MSTTATYYLKLKTDNPDKLCERGRKSARKWRESHPDRAQATHRRYHNAHREQRNAHSQTYRETHREERYEYKRQQWRRNKPRLAAMVADWTSFFDGLANDDERRIAAHVMLALADFDRAARAVVCDRSFDYNVLAPHFVEDAA